MRPLKGRNLRLALTGARAGAWALVAVLACLTALQVVSSARALSGERAEALAGGSRDEQEAESPAELPPIEEFAGIWQRLDPPEPEPEPEPEPVAPPDPEKPEPPPDPYPALRLIGTIVEEGSSYALIQLRPGVTHMLREGQQHEDIRLIGVREGEATLEVRGEARALQLETDNSAP